MSQNSFQIASGQVVGRDHRVVPRNCQDAHWVCQDEAGTVGIVADGCGSGAHSEVGAKLGVRFLTESILTEIRNRRSTSDIKWDRVQRHLLSSIDVMARSMGGNYRAVVEEYFLFTIVGVVLTDVDAVFFALGDGTVIINGKQRRLGPFNGNQPPYAGYGLLLEDLNIDPVDIRLRPVATLALDGLEHFLIGSDGVDDLIAAADKPRPGLMEPVGDISQFWTAGRYFAGNPDLVSRSLRLLARDWPRKDPQPGVLPDDTTIIVGRRTPVSNAFEPE